MNGSIPSLIAWAGTRPPNNLARVSVKIVVFRAWRYKLAKKTEENKGSVGVRVFRDPSHN